MTGGPTGLPVLLAAALALGACGKEHAAGFASHGASLWEVPSLPAPTLLEVNGRAVDPVVVEGYLLSLWTEHWMEQAQGKREATAASFYAEPRALLTPLVRGMLLIQEAEARWPDLDPAETGQLREDMAAGAGGAYSALLRRIGEDGMQAHVAREVRKRKLLAAFAADAEPVTDEELYRRYDEMMAGVDDPAPLLERGINFAALAPRLRAELEREHAVIAEEAWIDEVLPAARVRVVLPDGREVSW